MQHTVCYALTRLLRASAVLQAELSNEQKAQTVGTGSIKMEQEVGLTGYAWS